MLLFPIGSGDAGGVGVLCRVLRAPALERTLLLLLFELLLSIGAGDNGGRTPTAILSTNIPLSA